MPGPIAQYVASKPKPVAANPAAALNEKAVYYESMGWVHFWPYLGTVKGRRQPTDYRKVQCFRDMLHHDAVKAPLLQKVHHVASLDLTTTPASDSPRDGEIAEFVKYQFTDAVEGEFQQVAETILLPMLLTKHTVAEKVWHKPLWNRGKFAGKRFYRTFKAKENAEPVFDQFRNFVGVKGIDANGDEVTWSPEDFIFLRNLPLFEDDGTSDLEAVYDLVYQLDTLEKLHDIHLEKYTTPAVHASYDQSVQEVYSPLTKKLEPIQKSLEPNLKGFGSRNYLITPDGVKVTALQLAATGGEQAFLTKCDELRQRIALAIAGAYLQMLAQQGTEVRGDSTGARTTAELVVWALAAKLSSVLNTQATPELVRMNYQGADYPKISLGGINYGELQKSIMIDEAGQRMGAPLSLKAMSRKYGWQLAAKPDDVLRPAVQGFGLDPFAGGVGAAGPPGPPALSPEAGGQGSAGLPAGNGDGAPPAADPEAAASTGDVQGTALNGAQIASLLEITAKITTGELTPGAAAAIMTAAFPLMEGKTIMDIVTRVKTPAQGAVTPPPPGGGGAFFPARPAGR